MGNRGTRTRYPGVFLIAGKDYLIRAKTTDLRTGRKKEVERLIRGVSVREAAQQRAELVVELLDANQAPARVRVGEFARSWIESKALRLDRSTARTYAKALDAHILPALGDFYYDALTSRDVQRWIDDAIRRGWVSETRGKKRGGDSKQGRRTYTRGAIAVWFRTFRTMTRDAMAELDLQRDPTLRVALPEAEYDREESKAITAEQLVRFIEAFKVDHPQHHALVVMLAFTGLRFCHASALRWQDWDEQTGVIRVERKQVGRKVGPVSRKKRAPKEYPVEPELAAVLREHRHRLLVDQAPGLAEGWMFPTRVGTLRTPSSMDKAWKKALVIAGITSRFTLHGLRYTFTDLVRRANVDAVVRRALTGHVTEEMQRHYSTVGMDEKRAAVAGVIRLLPPVTPTGLLPSGGAPVGEARRRTAKYRAG